MTEDTAQKIFDVLCEINWALRHPREVAANERKEQDRLVGRTGYMTVGD